MKQKFKVVWSETAENDLIDIIAYIIRDSRSNASKIFRKIKNKANSLNLSPQRGRIVPELRDQGITQYRELIISRWRLIYRVAEKNIYIESVYKVEYLLFSVIPACPESLFKKDSRLASLAGMTNYCSLYTDSI